MENQNTAPNINALITDGNTIDINAAPKDGNIDQGLKEFQEQGFTVEADPTDLEGKAFSIARQVAKGLSLRIENEKAEEERKLGNTRFLVKKFPDDWTLTESEDEDIDFYVIDGFGNIRGQLDSNIPEGEEDDADLEEGGVETAKNTSAINIPKSTSPLRTNISENLKVSFLCEHEIGSTYMIKDEAGEKVGSFYLMDDRSLIADNEKRPKEGDQASFPEGWYMDFNQFQTEIEVGVAFVQVYDQDGKQKGMINLPVAAPIAQKTLNFFRRFELGVSVFESEEDKNLFHVAIVLSDTVNETLTQFEVCDFVSPYPSDASQAEIKEMYQRYQALIDEAGENMAEVHTTLSEEAGQILQKHFPDHWGIFKYFPQDAEEKAAIDEEIKLLESQIKSYITVFNERFALEIERMSNPLMELPSPAEAPGNAMTL